MYYKLFLQSFMIGDNIYLALCIHYNAKNIPWSCFINTGFIESVMRKLY